MINTILKEEDDNNVLKHKQYTVVFAIPRRHNMNNEGKTKILNGIHPDHEDVLSDNAGLKTKMGHVVQATVKNNDTGGITKHHIFQAYGNPPMASVSPIGTHDSNDIHNDVVHKVLSQPRNK